MHVSHFMGKDKPDLDRNVFFNGAKTFVACISSEKCFLELAYDVY